jgi:small subunit ribosomal protein S15
MALLKEQVATVVKSFRRSELDTGSPEVQIALLTYQIKELTSHFQNHPKDFHGRRGLLTMVNQRKRHLAYLKNKDFNTYSKIIAELGIRK